MKAGKPEVNKGLELKTGKVGAEAETVLKYN